MLHRNSCMSKKKISSRNRLSKRQARGFWPSLCLIVVSALLVQTSTIRTGKMLTCVVLPDQQKQRKNDSIPNQDPMLYHIVQHLSCHKLILIGYLTVYHYITMLGQCRLFLWDLNILGLLAFSGHYCTQLPSDSVYCEVLNCVFLCKSWKNLSQKIV